MIFTTDFFFVAKTHSYNSCIVRITLTFYTKSAIFIDWIDPADRTLGSNVHAP
jgi:hypothetical protein